MWLLVLVFTILLVWLYQFITKLTKYWKDKNILYIKPWPLSEKSILNAFRNRSGMDEWLKNIYNKYPDKRYVGIYSFLQPILLLRDPDLIKNITVKWFDSFADHRRFASKDSDPFWAKNIFAMKAQDGWHDIRSTVSPSFTSSKLKIMYELMQKCAENLSSHFEKQDGTIEMEVQETFTRFAVDVIGTTAFGVTANSLDDPNNDFLLMGKDAANFSGLRSLKIVGFQIIPKIMKLLDIGIFSTKVKNFFRNVIKETIKFREENQLVRPDMIHLLLEARKGRLQYEDSSSEVDSGFAVVDEPKVEKTQIKQKPNITDEDITALAVGFFFAGFHTISTAMSFLAYELAINLDVQERLFTEIAETAKDSDKKINYEKLLGMKYLDMVISELLRKRPPAIMTDRDCIKPFTIEPEKENETPLHLEKDTILWIPISAIHRNPEYYPNPDKFDPERFTNENRQNIKPFTYLPFGAGPRNCIGSRFAVLEMKLLITEILRRFEIVPCAKTPIPLKPSRRIFGTLPDGGIWLSLQRRNNPC